MLGSTFGCGGTVPGGSVITGPRGWQDPSQVGGRYPGGQLAGRGGSVGSGLGGMVQPFGRSGLAVADARGEGLAAAGELVGAAEARPCAAVARPAVGGVGAGGAGLEGAPVGDASSTADAVGDGSCGGTDSDGEGLDGTDGAGAGGVVDERSAGAPLGALSCPCVRISPPAPASPSRHAPAAMPTTILRRRAGTCACSPAPLCCILPRPCPP
ncbi:hypothetical protein C2142_37045 [Streptomyces sp. CB01881]|nr:hypothetical protein C2142_37045 [Streptomyces sp. CB01881]